MKTDLIITFTSLDKPGVVETLTRTVAAHRGNWEESRLARLCGDFAGIARVSVAEENQSALIEALVALGNDDMQVSVRVGSASSAVANGRRIRLRCTGADTEGIANSISRFLSVRRVNVEEMVTSIVPAPTTGTPVFNMSCEISLPSDIQEEDVRQPLAALAGELGVDITLDGTEI